MKIPALSIRNPWAWLCANGFKPLENRSWNTSFRGTFLIHASKGMTKDECSSCFDLVRRIPGMRERIINHTGEGVINWRHLKENFSGGIIGVADLKDVVHERDRNLLSSDDEPWFFGEYGFILENARPLPFLPAKGQLGFFNLDVPEGYIK